MSTALQTAPHRRQTWHQAFDAQMGLWRWMRTEPGREWMFESYRIAARDLNEDNREMIGKLYSSEESKLLGADPVFVSAEMCEIIDAARGTFDPEPLFPTDLLTGNGFLYFEKPFAVLDRWETPMEIAAISWTPILTSSEIAEQIAKDGTVMEYLQQRDYTSAWPDDDGPPTGSTPIEGIAITIYTTTKHELEVNQQHPEWNLPDIVPTHLTPWWFGMTYGGNDFDVHGKPTGAGWWWRIAQASFRLMQQQIAVRHNERPDRPTRRDAVRRGFHERNVVVVRLRREKRPESGEPMSEANYSHRFIVGGHWRNQWYPSGRVHRQIWISPYVKGPEAAPLVVRPRRVFTWNR